MSEWIKAEDELPPLEQVVWCRTPQDQIFVGGRVIDDESEKWMWANTYGSFWFNGENWTGDLLDRDEVGDYYQVTHWMALPQLLDDDTKDNYE